MSYRSSWAIVASPNEDPSEAFQRGSQVLGRLHSKGQDLAEKVGERCDYLPASEKWFVIEGESRNFKRAVHGFYTRTVEGIVELLHIHRITVLCAPPRLIIVRLPGGGSRLQWSDVEYLGVLEAIDPDGPLHETLGKEPLRRALWELRELVHGWEDSDESEVSSSTLGVLDWALRAIFRGLKASYAEVAARMHPQATV